MSPKINENPKFTMALVQAGCFRDNPMTVVDIGASGGYAAYWNHFCDQLRVIGFEPNPEEYLKCNLTPISTVYPVALGKRKETKTLTVTRWPYSSSTVPFNMEFWNRFPNAYMFEPVKTERFETTDFDSFCAENNIGNFDFLKIDTEGSELEILEGSNKMLDSGVLAVFVEVAFYPYHTGRPLFSDIDVFLRGKGFNLYDMETVRLARSSLPPLNTYVAEASNYGQILGGDALYMRDLVGVPEFTADINPVKLLKSVCLFEIFGLQDCAIELLEYALTNCLIPQEFRGVIDLLVPKVFNRDVSLEDYRKMFSNLPQLI